MGWSEIRALQASCEADFIRFSLKITLFANIDLLKEILSRGLNGVNNE